MNAKERERDAQVERAMLNMLWGWDELPCDLCGCKVSRKYDGKVRCFWHYDGPLQLELAA